MDAGSLPPGRPSVDARRRTPADRRARRAAVDDPEEVLRAALRRLEIRAFSVAGLRRRLVDAGYRVDLVEEALGRLDALGVLDDTAYARDWVEARDRARPRGTAVLRRELVHHGVGPEVIEAVLAERSAAAADGGGPVARSAAPDGYGRERDADERAAASLLARRSAGLARVADPRLRRQRAYTLLARHGFDPDVCSAAVAAWLARVGQAPDH